MYLTLDTSLLHCEKIWSKSFIMGNTLICNVGKQRKCYTWWYNTNNTMYNCMHVQASSSWCYNAYNTASCTGNSKEVLPSHCLVSWIAERAGLWWMISKWMHHFFQFATNFNREKIRQPTYIQISRCIHLIWSCYGLTVIERFSVVRWIATLSVGSSWHCVCLQPAFL